MFPQEIVSYGGPWSEYISPRRIKESYKTVATRKQIEKKSVHWHHKRSFPVKTVLIFMGLLWSTEGHATVDSGSDASKPYLGVNVPGKGIHCVSHSWEMMCFPVFLVHWPQQMKSHDLTENVPLLADQELRSLSLLHVVIGQKWMGELEASPWSCVCEI